MGSWKNDVMLFYIAWNKSVRRLASVSNITHTYLLKYISERPHVTEQIYLRTGRLISSMMVSKNPLIKFMAGCNFDNFDSIIGGNLSEVSKYTSLSKEDILNHLTLKRMIWSLDSEEKVSKGRILTKLLEIRDSKSFEELFDAEFVDTLISEICMN